MFRQNIARSLHRHPRPSRLSSAVLVKPPSGPTGTRPLSSTVSPRPQPFSSSPPSLSLSLSVSLRPHHRRALGTSGPFSPIHGPPPPASLGAPQAARAFRRTTKWTRRLLLLSAAAGTLYLADRQLSASGLARSLRTFYTGLRVALDYKLNFRAHPLPLLGTPGGIEALHRRSAERMFELLRHNGGLYLKIGQAIAMQSAVLPPEFQQMFSRMFDDAPQRSWDEVEKVIRDDFGGAGAQEVFGVSWAGAEGKGVMERTARASASVAQVHWARLPDGREVAVKIQKPEIKKQIGWDLWAFKVVTWVYSRWFDLPLYSLVPFITERLELETDFVNEANNSETMRKLVASEPSLRGRVYVPIVYPELSSRRVLTTEWIEGIRLWDKAAMTGPWIGGHGKGSIGVQGTQLPPPDIDAIRHQLRMNPDSDKLKPERTGWKGRNGKGGLGLSTKEVMTIMVDLFSAQIFKWGVVHCDPHPGNIFIRRLPSGNAELVLIDHGLYVYMSPKFRHEYGMFWKALMTFDNQTIKQVTEEWGIKAADIFASATLMRPYEGGDGSFKKGLREAGDDSRTASERSFEMQRRMKQGIRDILADEDKWPKELIFIGRNMRIVQGNNQYMGSPVNRVKMMGEWASRSLFMDPTLSWPERLRNRWRHLLFKGVMLGSDVLFFYYKIRQWLGLGGGMEDEIEESMRRMGKEMGVDLQHGVFEG